jgi:hypothetical protein
LEEKIILWAVFDKTMPEKPGKNALNKPSDLRLMDGYPFTHGLFRM